MVFTLCLKTKDLLSDLCVSVFNVYYLYNHW